MGRKETHEDYEPRDFEEPYIPYYSRGIISEFGKPEGMSQTLYRDLLIYRLDISRNRDGILAAYELRVAMEEIGMLKRIAIFLFALALSLGGYVLMIDPGNTPIQDATPIQETPE